MKSELGDTSIENFAHYYCLGIMKARERIERLKTKVDDQKKQIDRVRMVEYEAAELDKLKPKGRQGSQRQANSSDQSEWD